MKNSDQSTNLWHSSDEQQVYAKLESSPEGLTSSAVSQRLSQYGPNELEAQQQVSIIIMFLKQLMNPLIYLLAAATVVSLATGHVLDAGVIFAVIILNSVLGVWQEWRAEQALEALHQLAAPRAKVLRDSNAVEIAASDIVPGDILLLETGARVAADARVIESTELNVNESALTGESEPVFKQPGIVESDVSVPERTNMVYSSTPVTAGRGKALVVATGMRTEIGEIAGQVRSTTREETPLQKRMTKLSGMLGIAGLTLATGIFFLGLIRGYAVLEMVLFSIAAAVSATPAGLPAAISVTLALGVQRMAHRNAIVRRLPAVETLGSTTVICSDKTGTITKNEMTVRAIWAGGEFYEVSGEGYNPEGKIKRDSETVTALNGTVNKLLEIGCIANNARIQQNESGLWHVYGNATEGALVVAAMKAGIDITDLHQKNHRRTELPFSSSQKYMATLNVNDSQKDNAFLYVKGAPERILEFCSSVFIGGKEVTLTDELRTQIHAANTKFANNALRVMAGAYKRMPASQKKISAVDSETGLVFAGLWGMIDPPRPEAKESVQRAHNAGIKVVMITGDAAQTATAIGKSVGITDVDEPAITGKQIDQMDDETLAREALRIRLFARVSPHHKLKLMHALKKRGEIVAMTGDGVNDAPALKGADIGVSMGQSGTEVAKEAADMVLTDDNFATIVNAVEEGRVIFSNLRRVVFFLITTNLGELITLASALLLGMHLPVTAIMILWINLVTDGIATVPLGVEPKHSNVLTQPPQKPGSGIIDRPLIIRMALLSPLMAAGTLSLFKYYMQWDYVYAQTVAFTTLAAFQWFQTFNARSTHLSVFSIGLFTNKWLVVGISIAILLQVGAIHTPLGQSIFNTHPLTLTDWLCIIAVSSSITVVDEIRKALARFKNRSVSGL